MASLTDLLNALVAKHSMFFSQRWDSLSSADAKKFAQIERDMMEVRKALGQSGREMAVDLQECINRLSTSLDEHTNEMLVLVAEGSNLPQPTQTRSVTIAAEPTR
jgi:16S rRNA U1498 N3-methylase RsmE